LCNTASEKTGLSEVFRGESMSRFLLPLGFSLAAAAIPLHSQTEAQPAAGPQATSEAEVANLPLPTPQQLEWQDAEISMFYHFDLPVFTPGGRGNGMNWKQCGHLDPNLFNPAKLDTDQWLEAAKALGAKHTVLVAKHCSGFALWQTDAYPYGLKQTKWRDGKGDILQDYVASCRKAGIEPGIYVSWPANAHLGVDRGKVNFGKGGDAAKQSAYVSAYTKLITEAYGNYGPFREIWFDGSVPGIDQGGPDVAELLQRLQPKAVVFQGPTGSIRWVGNESGVAPDPCWATTNGPGDHGAGTPHGKRWMPAECDVPIRNHDWFWQPNAERKLYTLDQLMDMYYRSVGRNCNLLLNANIDRDGLVPEADMRRYREFAAEIQRRFGRAVAETKGSGETVTLSLGQPATIDHVIAMEDIRQGERVRKFVIEGQTESGWIQLSAAQCIGHKRIDRFPPVRVSAVRLRVTESVASPQIRRLAVFDVAGSPAVPPASGH